MNENPQDTRLNEAERRFLLDLASRAVSAAVRGAPEPDPRERAEAAGLELEPRLCVRRGAFVTLHLAGALQGCIGYIEGHKPLVDAVIDNARSAAVNDPRFTPVQAHQLSDLEIEISALTPLRGLNDVFDIELGRHGILLEKGGRQAVFLPQVAPEQGWDLTTTLGHLCLKAGLAPGDWQAGSTIRVFEAEVF